MKLYFTPKFKQLLEDLTRVKNNIAPTVTAMEPIEPTLKPLFPIVYEESFQFLPEGITEIEFIKTNSTYREYEHYYYINEYSLRVGFYVRENFNPEIEGPFYARITKSFVSASHNNENDSKDIDLENNSKPIDLANEVTLWKYIFKKNLSGVECLFDIKVVALIKPEKDDSTFNDATSSIKMMRIKMMKNSEELELFVGSTVQEVSDAEFSPEVTSGDDDRTVSSSSDENSEVVGASDNTNKVVSLSDNTNKVVSPSDNPDKVISLTDNTNKVISLSDNINKVVSLTDNPNKVVSLSDNTNKIVSLTDNPNEAISPSDNLGVEKPDVNSHKHDELNSDSDKVISTQKVSLFTKVKTFFSRKKQSSVEQKKGYDQAFHGFSAERSKLMYL